MDTPQVTEVTDHTTGDPGAAHLEGRGQGSKGTAHPIMPLRCCMVTWKSRLTRQLQVNVHLKTVTVT